jgi:16S rRNA (guanine527-N7)-methyltransferase
MGTVDSPLAVAGICRKNGLVLTDVQMGLLADFVGRLLEWNKKINLISRRDEGNVWFSHVLHSLAPLFYVNIPGNISILDLGSGGGFPGIPLAIVRPDLKLTLLDSIRKKTMATTDIVGAIKLPNIVIQTARAEELAQSMGGKYDMVVARAVASLADLVRWSKPLIRRKGTATPGQSGVPSGKHPSPSLLALKGGDLDGEIQEVRVKVRPAHIETVAMNFPGSEELGLEDKKLVLVSL